MVMGFEAPKTSGVHHDIAPPPVRMTIGERFAAASAKKKAEEGGEVIAINNTPEDDRISELLRAVNEKTGRAARAARDAESIPVAAAEVATEAASEVAVEAVVEAAPEKSAEELAAEDKAMREKAMVRAAEIRRSKIQAQAALTQARSVLMSTADAVPMATKVERPPMPSVDQMQEIDIPGFGKAMILSVDPDSQLMYFATPEERRKADAMMAKDEGMSSRGAANYSKENVIALTPDQARQYIAAANAKRRFANVDTTPAAEAVPANNQTHLKNRYGLTG